MTAIDLSLIRPDRSGKYSPLLYKWLKKNQGVCYSSVFHLKHSRIDGSPTVTGDWWPNDLWIGNGQDAGWIHGNSLSSIICKNAKHGWALPIGDDYTDITDQFWDEYIRIGRCAWDRAHQMYMIGDDDRYHYHSGGNGRRCNWCGREFEVERRTVVEVRQREEWKDYRSSVVATLLNPMGSLGEDAA